MANRDGHAPAGEGCFDRCGKYHRWRIGIQDPATGKTHYKSIKAKSMRLLQEKVNLWKEEHGVEPSAPVSKRWRVADFVQTWLDAAAVKCTPITLNHYCMIARAHILPAFGSMWLNKVSPLALQSYFNGLLKAHTTSTVAEIRSVFRACFSLAVKYGILLRNPVLATTPPYVERTELQIIEENDVSRILEAAENGEYLNFLPASDSREYLRRRNHLMILLAASAGLRIGEVLGLTWECIGENELQIKHSLQDISGKRVLKSPKSHKSRIVVIPSSIAAAFVGWKEFQSMYAAKYRGVFKNELELVFTGVDGGCVITRSFTARYYKKICKSAGVENQKFHSLRHFAASSAIAHGIPIPVVSEQLGHANIEVTLRRYTHALSSSKNELKKYLDSVPLFA